MILSLVNKRNFTGWAPKQALIVIFFEQLSRSVEELLVQAIDLGSRQDAWQDAKPNLRILSEL
jgi:ABC-type uncharacterized transport system permease subunit